jgi:hypothetical protein
VAVIPQHRFRLAKTLLVRFQQLQQKTEAELLGKILANLDEDLYIYYVLHFAAKVQHQRKALSPTYNAPHKMT